MPFPVQGLFHRGMRAADIQHGWDVAVTATHIAVTLPLPTCAMAVYAFHVSLHFMQLPRFSVRGARPTGLTAWMLCKCVCDKQVPYP